MGTILKQRASINMFINVLKSRSHLGHATGWEGEGSNQSNSISNYICDILNHVIGYLIKTTVQTVSQTFSAPNRVKSDELHSDHNCLIRWKGLGELHIKIRVKLLYFIQPVSSFDLARCQADQIVHHFNNLTSSSSILAYVVRRAT